VRDGEGAQKQVTKSSSCSHLASIDSDSREKTEVPVPSVIDVGEEVLSSERAEGKWGLSSASVASHSCSQVSMRLIDNTN